MSLSLPDTPSRYRPLGLAATVLLAGGLIAAALAGGGGFLSSVAYQLPEFGLLVLAMALPLIAGGINLAILAIANLSAVVAALTFGAVGDSPWLAPLPLFAGLATGCLTGALIGLLIAYLRIAPIIASLGALLVYTGVGILATNGAAVTGLPAFVPAFAGQTVAGIPLIALIFLAAAILVGVLLGRTPYGRYLSAVGYNETATAYSGIDTARIHLVAYTLSGLLGAVAGLVMLARFNSARMGYADSYLLTTLLAAVLGGIDPNGGRGRLLPLLAAIVLLQVTASGLNLAGANQHFSAVAWGGLLLAKLAYDRLRS